jgi:hypothetical protein
MNLPTARPGVGERISISLEIGSPIRLEMRRACVGLPQGAIPCEREGEGGSEGGSERVSEGWRVYVHSICVYTYYIQDRSFLRSDAQQRAIEACN